MDIIQNIIDCKTLKIFSLIKLLFLLLLFNRDYFLSHLAHERNNDHSKEDKWTLAIDEIELSSIEYIDINILEYLVVLYLSKELIRPLGYNLGELRYFIRFKKIHVQCKYMR